MCCPQQVNSNLFCDTKVYHGLILVGSLLIVLTVVLTLVLTLCYAAALMSEVYDDHKDDDGFLYINYSGENTFGSDQAGLETSDYAHWCDVLTCQA